MKKLTLLIFSYFFYLVAGAQTGLWTWMGGDNISSEYGINGTEKVAAASINSSAKINPVGRTGESGNPRFFGGPEQIPVPSLSYRNDLLSPVLPVTNSISITSMLSTTFCQNSLVTLTFLASGKYTAGNTFTAQLSNGAGSFGAPVAIGAVPGIAVGSYTIIGSIPAATTPGTAYRIRVVSSHPAVASPDNGTNISVRTSDGSGGCNSSLAPLPVTLLRFSAQPQGRSNLLSWTTATESNNSGFEVQGSPDGLTYAAIGFVNSKAAGGYSTGELAYSFTHRSPAGSVQYYRLRQLDGDGAGSLSPVVAIHRETAGAPAIFRVYPNPAAGDINLQLLAGRAETITLEISDMIGKPVRRVRQAVKEGVNTLRMDRQGLQPGIYLLRIVDWSGMQSPAVKVLLK